MLKIVQGLNQFAQRNVRRFGIIHLCLRGGNLGIYAEEEAASFL